MMKAITLTQPWATLVAIGAKRIETRDWPTKFTGELAIHSAKAYPSDARTLAAQEPFVEALTPWSRANAFRDPPRGVVVAVARLDHVWKFNDIIRYLIQKSSDAGRLPPHELEFGDFSPGRYGFHLSHVTALAEPVPCRGALGLWTVPPDVEREVCAQLAKTTGSITGDARLQFGRVSGSDVDYPPSEPL